MPSEFDNDYESGAEGIEYALKWVSSVIFFGALFILIVISTAVFFLVKQDLLFDTFEFIALAFVVIIPAILLWKKIGRTIWEKFTYISGV